ncbi:mechanosensitive ion channel family protein [Agrobacterium rhizogenes]|uniref:mechanosensitive ion channel family protein n=1 Tax=Rhizobium rhizogenes TaxID=359 RepID=UPI0006481B9C|nr:mechanosensitive ion channel family protein [Rhizobium rhizogenes]OCJ25996.1 mechanosensitive ion channel protein [Agrobacterium sp. B131/95]MDJ1636097.1 mechanosensitive ion channel family protein [Rhizobium rhizogenes]NTG07806.1 mechanosensitive ion channel family protein [Rhizobium rhizogenes]NTI02495.1 mechanosensitive ion channel family protein [Rhizobium rhizogenes]NTI09299.1 mechanosensitive ion channel family protein [Rhizobium rhizogenes]
MRLLKHRLRFLSLLLLGLSFAVLASPLGGGNAFAQDQQQVQPAQQSDQPVQSPPLANGLLDAAVADLNKAKKDFSSIEDASKGEGADDDTLVALSGRADDLNRSVAALSARLKPRFAEIDTRLTQLGAAPKEGQPPEAPIVTQERDRLTAERSQISAVTLDVDNLVAATNHLSMQLVEMRRKLFAETLFKRTGISAGTFEDAGTAFVDEGVKFSDAITSWIGFVVKAKLGSLLAAVFLSLTAAMIFLLGGYRLFGRYYVRDENIENPPYISRLSVAFWSTLIRTLSLAAFLVTSFLSLSNFNVLRPDIAPVLAAFFGFIWLVYFVGRLSNAVFAPFRPHWRLVKLSNKGAKSLSWCMQAMAVVNGLDYVFDRISESMGSPVVVTVAKSFFAALLIGLILITSSFGKPILAKSGDPDAPGRRWPHGMAIILRVLGTLLIFTAVIGYVGLARFIATQLIMTSAVLVTMYIGFQLGKAVSRQGVFAETIIGRFLENRFKLSDVALDQAGLVAGLATYAVALLTGIPLILLSWGFHIQDLELFAYRLFTEIRIGNMSISLVGILAGVLLFAGGYLVTRWFQRWLDGNVMARGQMDLGVRNSVKTGIGYLGIALAAIFAISAAGIDLSSLALVASALSVGIGFGLQNIVSNFVSGLILLVERPFKVGDWIVSGASEGIVKRISVRATEIETFRKQSIIVPNSELINASVGNWTHRNRLARSEIPVSVSFESDPRKVMDILLELVRSVPKVLKNPEPHVEFLRFGPSSLDFEMRFYLSDLSDGMEIRNSLRIEILKRFREEGISIPYPHQELHIVRDGKRGKPSSILAESADGPEGESEEVVKEIVSPATQQPAQSSETKSVGGRRGRAPAE